VITTKPTSSTLVTRATASFEEFRAGDRTAFDELMRTVTPLLWHTARGQGLDKETAEDVLQTVWLSLLRHADTVREPRTVVKWLLTSTRREAWRIRSRERDPRLVRQRFDATDGDDLPVEPTEQPEELVLQSQRHQRLWEHVQQLPPRCRALLRVVAFADRPDYAEIAQGLAMPVGSIGPTRGRCLAKLRTLLTDDPAWEL